MSNAINVTTANIDEVTSSNNIVFLDFWAEWCGPCKAFAPVFEKAAADNADVVFGKVDTEEQEELSRRFEIRSIPMLVAFKAGQVVFAQAGAMPQQSFADLIQKVRDLDISADV